MVLAAVEDPTTSLGVMGPLDSATTIEKVGDQHRDGGLRARPHADRRRHAAGPAASRVRPVRGPEHDALDDAARRRQRPAGRRRAGSPAGFGALGPGHRANASIGRAVRLCLLNIGGGQARRLRHGAARARRQVHDVPDRGRRPVAVAGVLGRRRLRPVRLGRHGDRRRGAALGRLRRRRRRSRLARSACCGSSPGRSPTRARTTRSSAPVGGRRPQPGPRRRARPGRVEARRRAVRAAPPGRPTGAASCAT